MFCHAPISAFDLAPKAVNHRPLDQNASCFYACGSTLPTNFAYLPVSISAKVAMEMKSGSQNS
jgi:hypothetical protein